MFDILSKLKLRRKWRNKILRIYDQISEHSQGHDFLYLNLINELEKGKSQNLALTYGKFLVLDFPGGEQKYS